MMSLRGKKDRVGGSAHGARTTPVASARIKQWKRYLPLRSSLLRFPAAADRGRNLLTGRVRFRANRLRLADASLHRPPRRSHVDEHSLLPVRVCLDS